MKLPKQQRKEAYEANTSRIEAIKNDYRREKSMMENFISYINDSSSQIINRPLSSNNSTVCKS
jgi:hypothetical protein